MSTLRCYGSLIDGLSPRTICVFKILHEDIQRERVLGSLAVLREASNGHYWMGRACSFRDLIGPTGRSADSCAVFPRSFRARGRYSRANALSFLITKRMAVRGKKKKCARRFSELDALKAFRCDERRSMVAGRCSELRADILSIYEKNPICVTRDAMLCVGWGTEREKRGKRERELEKDRVGGGVRG